MKEVTAAGLKLPFRIYGPSCRIANTASWRFCQIPDEILAQMPLSDGVTGLIRPATFDDSGTALRTARGLTGTTQKRDRSGFLAENGIDSMASPTSVSHGNRGAFPHRLPPWTRYRLYRWLPPSDSTLAQVLVCTPLPVGDAHPKLRDDDVLTCLRRGADAEQRGGAGRCRVV